MGAILLSDVWPIADPRHYKLHFARRNDINVQPLEVFVRNRREWQAWQEYRPKRDDFNRARIFSVASFYHEPETWLFGGVWEVIGRGSDKYDVRLSDEGRPYIGRMKLRYPYKERATRVNFENHYGALEVAEILKEPYAGRSFTGFEDIDLSFQDLEAIVKNDRPDWKAPLESMKGVYLITDTLTGKRYVGSAYGDAGIWARWQAYVATGHGGNVELRALIADPSLDYCRQNFRFALLEHRPRATADDVVIAREAHWKRVLFTRGEDGMNRN